MVPPAAPNRVSLLSCFGSKWPCMCSSDEVNQKNLEVSDDILRTKEAMYL